MGAISPIHLIIILVIALIIIGPGKLPDTGAALGRAIRDFRRASSGELDDAAASTAAAAAPAAKPDDAPPAAPTA